MDTAAEATNRKLLLAYAEASRDLALPLVSALEAAGFDVTQTSGAQADAGIDAARTVIVCWTPAAAASDTVTLLAARARKAGKLASILLAPCAPPASLGGSSMLADLAGWRGDASDREFVTLVQAIHARHANRFLAAPFWRSRYVSWGGAGAIALGAVTIIANFGDLRQTIDGVINPAASEAALSATDAKVDEVLTLLKQRSPQPLSADAEAALRDSIERLLSAQSGARGNAADRLASGDLEGALTDLREAAQEGEALAAGLSETWQEIGALLYTTDTFGAIDAYLRAVQLSPKNPIARNQLGNLYLRTGQLAEAQRAFEDMLQFSEDDEAIGIANSSLGAIALRRGNTADARLWLEAGMMFNEKAGNLAAKGADLGDLGEIARMEGKLAEAERLFRESLAIAQQTSHSEGEAFAISRLGALMLERKRFDEADKLYAEAMAIAQAAGDQEGIAMAHVGLGDVAFDRGQLDLARTHYQAGYDSADAVAATDGLIHALKGLGSVAERQGNKTSAINYFREALWNYRDMGLTDEAATMEARLKSLGATQSPEGPER